MPEFTSFSEFQQQFFEYHGKPETQKAAFDLVTEAASQFPEQANLLYNWRYCSAALLNKPDLALQIFQEGLDAGFWWGKDVLINDNDLRSLLELPEFNRLVDVSEARRQAAQAATKPLALSLPLPTDAIGSLPILLVLHGNNSNAQDSVTFWESAVRQGWLTVLLQSSQIFAPNAFVWNDLDLGAQEIEAHYQELSEKRGFDPAQAVVGGFSKGGEMALWLALKEIIPLAGFILVNPGGPLIREVDPWLPILENCQTRTEMRGFLVAGEHDANLEQIKALREILVSHGLACELLVAPGIAHDFPADFNQVLARALDFITGRS